MPRSTETMNGRDLNADYAAITAQVESLKSELSRLTSMIGEATGDTSGDAAKFIQAKAAELRARAEIAAADTVTRADSFVKEKPGQALGVAVGIGFILGLWLSRR